MYEQVEKISECFCYKQKRQRKEMNSYEAEKGVKGKD
jgi:hypothetical protein